MAAIEFYSNQWLQRELTIEEMRHLLGLWGTTQEEMPASGRQNITMCLVEMWASKP